MTEQIEIDFARLSVGTERKHDGQDRVLHHQDAGWKDRIERVILEVANRQPVFSSDDVRQVAELAGVGQPMHPNAWGAALSAAGKRGEIRKTGQYCQSARPDAHARMVAIWRLT